MEPEGASHRTLLFVPEHNRGKAEFFTDRVYGELWVGRHRGLDESQIFFGVDRCRPLQEIGTILTSFVERPHSVRLVRGHNRAIDGALEPSDNDDEFGDASFGDAPGQGRVRNRRAAQSVRDQQARIRRRHSHLSTREERARNRRRVLEPRAHRSQRRRLPDDRRRRAQRVHAALESQRRRGRQKRAAAARRGRRVRFALHCRHYAHVAARWPLLARTARGLRHRLRGAACRHRRRRTR